MSAMPLVMVFSSYQPANHRVARLKDHTHSSATEFPDDLVFAELFQWVTLQRSADCEGAQALACTVCAEAPIENEPRHNN
jgi:hypothetical protein